MQIEISFEDKKKVNASFNGMVIRTDQPVEAGGNGTAPAPFDMFLASIGTCAGIYVKSFCDQRGISTNNIKIIQHIEYNQLKRMIGKIRLEIKLPADFPEAYKKAVVHAADICAVKKHLQDPPEFETYIS